MKAVLQPALAHQTYQLQPGVTGITMDVPLFRHFLLLIPIALTFCCGSSFGETLKRLPQGTRRVLIICGHPGDDEHHTLFAETVSRLHRGLISTLGLEAEQIDLQFGDNSRPADPEIILKASGHATRDEITANVAKLQAIVQPDDSMWVIVMGHAHFDGRHSYLNLPGPDLRDDEFAKLFADVNCREQVYFITCPVSGYFIKPLAGKHRIIMTATEADLELNETECPHALADILSNPPPHAEFDVDQDGELTLFDLYIVMARRVMGRYEKEKTIATEHGLIEDNGDGRGTDVQIDYLTEEQGGRTKPRGAFKKAIRDGELSRKSILKIMLPAKE